MPSKKSIKQVLRSVGRAVNNLVFAHPPPEGVTQLEQWARQASNDGRMIWGPELGEVLVRDLPPTLGSLSDRFTANLRRQSPPLFVADLPKGRVYGRDGVVVTPDNRIPTDVSYDYGVRSSHSLQSQGNLPTPRNVSGRLAAIACTGHRGYFHWVFDAVPRFGLLEDVPVDHYYVDTRFGFQREYLQLLGIPVDKIIPAGRRTHLRAESLIVPSLPGGTGNPTTRSCQFLQALKARAASRTSLGDRIYVSRGDAKYRRVLNENEVVQALIARGFRIVHLQGRSVPEQMAIFDSAKTVVAPHGAGLSNLVYCQPGTRVVELFAPSYVNACYWSLSEICGLRYRYLVGSEPAGRNQRSERGSMLADIGLLQDSIDRIEAPEQTTRVA